MEDSNDCYSVSPATIISDKLYTILQSLLIRGLISFKLYMWNFIDGQRRCGTELESAADWIGLLC